MWGQFAILSIILFCVRARGANISCPAHPNEPLVEDAHAGDLICPMCGLVVGDRIIDVGSEWRTFSNDKDTKDSSRVGAAEVLSAHFDIPIY